MYISEPFTPEKARAGTENRAVVELKLFSNSSNYNDTETEANVTGNANGKYLYTNTTHESTSMYRKQCYKLWLSVE